MQAADRPADADLQMANSSPSTLSKRLFQIRRRPLTVKCCAADLQMVNISLRVLSKPDTHLLSQIFRSLGIDWDERVLPSIGNEILKAVVAQYNAEQLLTQRDRVSRAVSRPPAALSEET